MDELLRAIGSNVPAAAACIVICVIFIGFLKHVTKQFADSLLARDELIKRIHSENLTEMRLTREQVLRFSIFLERLEEGRIGLPLSGGQREKL